jgi:hypothetical protein
MSEFVSSSMAKIEKAFLFVFPLRAVSLGCSIAV